MSEKFRSERAKAKSPASKMTNDIAALAKRFLKEKFPEPKNAYLKASITDVMGFKRKNLRILSGTADRGYTIGVM